jgi:hypothetical protein
MNLPILRIKDIVDGTVTRPLFVLWPSHRPAMPKKRLHAVRRPRTDVDDRLPAVRTARAVRDREAHQGVRRREATDLVQAMVKCPKAKSVSVYDRCEARCEGLTTR